MPGPSRWQAWRPPQLSNQAVVPTTTADRGLGTELITGDLEGGVAVVVEATHQTRIEPEGNAQGGEPLLHGLKPLATLGLRASARVGACSSKSWVSLFLESRIRSGLLLRRARESASSCSSRCSSQATRAER